VKEHSLDLIFFFFEMLSLSVELNSRQLFLRISIEILVSTDFFDMKLKQYCICHLLSLFLFSWSTMSKVTFKYLDMERSV
jgi:hypothetical protein